MPGLIVMENSPAELVRVILFATETVADCKTVSTSFTCPFMMPSCAKETEIHIEKKISVKHPDLETFLKTDK